MSIISADPCLLLVELMVLQGHSITTSTLISNDFIVTHRHCHDGWQRFSKRPKALSPSAGLRTSMEPCQKLQRFEVNEKIKIYYFKGPHGFKNIKQSLWQDSFSLSCTGAWWILWSRTQSFAVVLSVNKKKAFSLLCAWLNETDTVMHNH